MKPVSAFCINRLVRLKIPALIHNFETFSLFPLLLLLIFQVSGCNIITDYPGFSRTRSGIYYRLNVIGEGDAYPLPGDYITVDLSYSTSADSLFFSARRKFQLEKPSYAGSVEECFTMMKAGDQADFILNANEFFIRTLGVTLPAFLNESDHIKISVKMLDVQSEQSYTTEKQAFLSWIEDFREHEKLKIQQFIIEEQLDAKPDSSGLYYITISEGTGKNIEPGDRIELHFEGKFLYGKFFDSTRERGEVFEFVYGQELQVLEGLERAVGRMREGEKALILMPSDLGFGQYGSSTGIIPPYTPLVYELEILSVK